MEVVAALIRQGSGFLIFQRPPQKAQGLLWEFAGGKVEPGETPEQALVRECREELGVTVRVGEAYMDVTHRYPSAAVHLTLFRAEVTAGTVQPLEHRDIRCVTPAEMAAYPFCPADRPFVEQLQRDYPE